MDRETFEQTLAAIPAASPCVIYNFQEILPSGDCLILEIWEYPVGWSEMLGEDGEPIMYFLQVEPSPPVEVP